MLRGNSVAVGISDCHDASDKIRNFYKVKNACIKLKEAISCIYEYGYGQDELNELRSSNSDLNQVIGSSSTMFVSAALHEMRKNNDIISLFESFEFDEANSELDPFIECPVVYDEQLENLAFIHKSVANTNNLLNSNERIALSNERLEFLGDSWLGALVAYIVYAKFPNANEGLLSKIKESIVCNNNLYLWSQKLKFDTKLIGNIAVNSKIIKGKHTKRYADCVEAYIGALVLDRFGSEFLELRLWIEKMAANELNDSNNLLHSTTLNRNAKNELAGLLLSNKLGYKLNYKKLTNKSPFIIEVRLGDIVLAKSTGNNVKEAEIKAAMEALKDNEIIKKYSTHEIVDNPSYKTIHNVNSLANNDVSISKNDPSLEYDVEKLIEDSTNSADIQKAQRQPKSSEDEDDYTEELNKIKAEVVPFFLNSIEEKFKQIIQSKDNRGFNKLEFSNDYKLRNDGLIDETSMDKVEINNKKTKKIKKDKNKTMHKYDSVLNDCNRKSKDNLYVVLSKQHLLPNYNTRQQGERYFISQCTIKGVNILIGEAEGRNKRVAEQRAAEVALKSNTLKNILKDLSKFNQ